MGASPAGLTARVRPEARPEARGETQAARQQPRPVVPADGAVHLVLTLLGIDHFIHCSASLEEAV